MAEVRVDPLTGLRVIVAADRGARPGAWLATTAPDPIDPASDPFLEGHEAQTPPELAALRDGTPPDGPGWRVRVVPNRYPALTPGADEPEAMPMLPTSEPFRFAVRPDALSPWGVVAFTTVDDAPAAYMGIRCLPRRDEEAA